MFPTFLKTNANFWVTFILLSANDFNLVKSKILALGKEVRNFRKHPNLKTYEFNLTQQM